MCSASPTLVCAFCYQNPPTQHTSGSRLELDPSALQSSRALAAREIISLGWLHGIIPNMEELGEPRAWALELGCFGSKAVQGSAQPYDLATSGLQARSRCSQWLTCTAEHLVLWRWLRKGDRI